MFEFYTHILAQALEGGKVVATRPTAPGSVYLWGSVIVALAIIGGVAMMVYRKNVLAKDDAGNPEGFTLHELQQLRDQGHLTQSEYEVAKNQIAQSIKKKLASPKKHKNEK